MNPRAPDQSELHPDAAAPPARKLRMVLVVVGTGTLLGALAGSSVTLALPSLGRDLAIPLSLSSWVMQGYLLVVTSLLLVAGRLADLLGHRRVYLAGFLIFGAASALCGLAPSFPLVVAARLLQGVGGALLMAVAPALLTTSFPAARRGQALGLMSTATYTGLTLGPPLGGLLISTLGWRWVFFINVPTAALVLLLGLLFLPRDRPGRGQRLDLAGAGLLLAGLLPLLLALGEGRDGALGASATLAMAGVGLALLVAFVLVERRRAAPLLNLGLFRSATFSGATLSAICNYVALFVPIILLPFYVTEGLGRSSSQAGLLLSVQPLVMAVVASPAGWLSDRIGARPLATAGMLVMTAGVAGLTTLDAASPTALVAAWLAGVGLGTGIFISPNSSALMGAAPRQLQGTAGGVLATARNLGMMIGVAAATALYHGYGGETGRAWLARDFQAMHAALWVASAVCLLGAAAAFVGQRRGRQQQPDAGAASKRSTRLV